MNPPLRLAFPVSIKDLKASYALFVFEEHTERNLTRTAEILDCTRSTAREWVKQGREVRRREEMSPETKPVDFIEIRKPEEEEPPDAPIPG